MDLHERAAVLARMLGCSDASAQSLSDMVQFKTYSPGAILAHQGDICDTFWMVVKGVIQLRAHSVEGQATIISASGPGEMIGAYDPERDASFDTFAYTGVSALSINAQRLEHVVDKRPDLARGLARIFSGQLHLVLERLAHRVTLSASGRFYQALLKEAGAANEIAPPPIISVLALSAQTTRETGSRAISALERRGVIERSGEKLTIVSRRMLEEMIA